MPETRIDKIGKGLSVFVAQYPEKTPNVMGMFLCMRSLLNILASGKAPGVFRNRIENPLPIRACRSRSALTAWLLGMRKIPLWFRAQDFLDTPDRWGPHVWNLLHEIAPFYTPQLKPVFYQFLSSLPDVLPCKECAKHFKRLLAKNKHTWGRVKHVGHCEKFISGLHSQVTARVQREKKNKVPQY